jgi:hypothetical protein
MRTSYLHAGSPPRFPTRQGNSITNVVSPLNPSPTNGVDENRLTVRSASTSKMITTLQKEMDAIKTSSEAARAAAGILPENTRLTNRCRKSKP